MYRQRGRTVGTFIIAAIIVVAVIYAAFGPARTTAMLTPHMRAQLGAAEPSPQTQLASDLVINPTIEECKKGWEAGMKWTKEQFEQLCAQMQAAK